jgi:hypothetical protein
MLGLAIRRLLVSKRLPDEFTSNAYRFALKMTPFYKRVSAAALEISGCALPNCISVRDRIAIKAAPGGDALW